MSYLLDTNIISELRRGESADAKVLAWRRKVAYEETYISVLVLGEMRRGIELNEHGMTLGEVQAASDASGRCEEALRHDRRLGGVVIEGAVGVSRRIECGRVSGN